MAAPLTKPRYRVTTRGEVRGLVADDVARPRAKNLFFRNDRDPLLFAWNPVLREANQDVRNSWTKAVARTIDTLQNSGWVAGAVEQAIAMIIGTGLRLSAKPDAEALGWTADEAKEWSRIVERRYECWANRPQECDIEGKSTVGKLTAGALRSYFGFGEILALLPYVRRPWNQYGTKVQLLPPSRLMQDSNPPQLSQGIIRDPFGYPLAYRIAEPPENYSNVQWRDVTARDMFGRPSVVHVFDGMPGQMRGIPPLTPALKIVRQFDQLSDATLLAGLIQTIFAATVESAAPTEQVLQAFQDLNEQNAAKDPAGSTPSSPLEALLDMRAGWYENTKIDLGAHGKIAHLAPGDKLQFTSSNHPNENYDSFAKFLLREMARCIGVTFEQLTGDYNGATYSSVNSATSEVFMITLYRRANIASPFAQSTYEAWLEEEIDNGWIDFPGGLNGFIENRAAATRAHFRGPAKPQADVLKFARAIDFLRKNKIVTDEWICAEMGEDWLDMYEQLAVEKAERERLGIVDQVPMAPGSAGSDTQSAAEDAAQDAQDAA
jgi:lambda family phage portal protein